MSLKEDNLVKWYESVISNSGIAFPGLVKGTLFIGHRGWNIWEKIRDFIDAKYKQKGIKNVSFPTFIPVAEIEREKSRLSGFNPEIYLVSRSGDEERQNFFLRPTSEILFSHYFRNILESYEDLPLLFNQWCNVFRAEKNTKAFLRTCEFHWQEAHTLHLSKEEAMEYLKFFHETYKSLVKDLLNIAFLEGEKTVNERFPGSEKTLTLEAIMPDGQALQIATSHYLSKNFTETFDVKYTSRENVVSYPHQLSAGCSTRLIGALIMSHGDDSGLVLPLSMFDVHIKFLIINGAVTEGSELHKKFSDELKGYKVEWDFSSRSFGYKIKNEEMIGTPVSVILGPSEIKSNWALVKTRLSESKVSIPMDQLISKIKETIDQYSSGLYSASQKNLESSIVECSSLEEASHEILKNRKIALVPWFDDLQNEIDFKNEKLGFGPRCIKSRIVAPDTLCFYSKKPATAYVYFGRSY
ncbi:prolyl-tRNA synthetase [Mycoplasma haemofelis str. Langford 1]|uniref:Proline--tRNA ligase n=1 Tax=Mycoplasma haemofelis (strain Langford 1) TaxID=941640 RepID=E8ZGI7_MYCHL|nr:aminoacyl--tRNA ligase-related protein [Mycoplasma haemofelis]CBY92017.1 prolyl-tRNA synthetase [Mycoplasma haemofelis str. Langford 1]